MEGETHLESEKLGSGSIMYWPYRLKYITFFTDSKNTTNSYHLGNFNIMLSAFSCVTTFNPHSVSAMSLIFFQSPFNDQETEVQSDEMIFPKAHDSQQMAKPRSPKFMLS